MDPQAPRQSRFPWLTLILAALAAIALFASIERGGGVMPMSRSGMGVPSSAPASPPLNESDASIARPDYYGGDTPITDRREFLKTDYSAHMYTRDVQDLVQESETIIRTYDGRIDNTSSSEKHGYVQFAIPMLKFQEFKREIEDLVPSRFLTVHTSKQNLLPQKQSIEDAQQEIDDRIADLNEKRDKVEATYNATIRDLEAQLAKTQQEINTLSAGPNDSTAQVRLGELEERLTKLQARLSSEKVAQAERIATYDEEIKYAEASRIAIRNQDADLLDSVATVNGTLVFEWMSVWDMVQLYLPGFCIPAILGALAILAFMYERHLYFFKNY